MVALAQAAEHLLVVAVVALERQETPMAQDLVEMELPQVFPARPLLMVAVVVEP